MKIQFDFFVNTFNSVKTVNPGMNKEFLNWLKARQQKVVRWNDLLEALIETNSTEVEVNYNHDKVSEATKIATELVDKNVLSVLFYASMA